MVYIPRIGGKKHRKIEELDTGVVDMRKKCIKCSCTFISEKDFKYHQKGCRLAKSLHCGEEFGNTLALRSHKITEYEKKFKCDKCDMCFPSKRNLQRHHVIHSVVKIECEIYGAQLATTSLKRHLKTTHNK